LKQIKVSMNRCFKSWVWELEMVNIGTHFEDSMDKLTQLPVCCKGIF
jgi:hypothetical protein